MFLLLRKIRKGYNRNDVNSQFEICYMTMYELKTVFLNIAKILDRIK